MTLVEQVIEWAVTHGTGALAGVGSALVTAWAGRRRAAARTEEAIAATVERSLEREKKLSERIESLEVQLRVSDAAKAALEAAREQLGGQLVEKDATNATLADIVYGQRAELLACEAGRAELTARVEHGERRMRAWEQGLSAIGISLDDSDGLSRLGEVIAIVAEHEREERGSRRTIAEIDARKARSGGT